MTPEQYLELDRNSQVRNEYCEGHVYAMAGGSPRHAQLIMAAALQVGLAARKRGCTPYSSDLRIKAGPYFFYPDMSVVCGPVQVSGDIEPSVTNPVLIVEVLSRMTESFDRGRKFIAYRSIPTLQEYVLVAQEQPRVERFSRNTDGTWLYTDAFGMDSTIHLASLEADIALSEIYRGVEFEPHPEEA